MFESIIRSNEVLDQISILAKKLALCDGDDLMYLKEVFKSVLKGTDPKKQSHESMLVTHLYKAFDQIGRKKAVSMIRIIEELSEDTGMDLTLVTDESIIEDIKVSDVLGEYWKYDPSKGLYSKKREEVTYYSTDAYDVSKAKYYTEVSM